jgi:hypothetical protein
LLVCLLCTQFTVRPAATIGWLASAFSDRPRTLKRADFRKRFAAVFLTT